MTEEHNQGSGNGLDKVREALDGAPEIPPTGLDEVDVEAVKAKHRGLTGELDRLAELKRRVLARQLEGVVFEAELRGVAETYKKKGMTPARVRDAVEQRLRPPTSEEEARESLAAGARSQRDEVLEIGLAGELWHDADREAYATIRRERHRETWHVRSRDYRLHLTAEYRDRYGRAPAKQALAEGIDAIEAAAVLDGAEHETFVRVAGSPGGDKVYLDLRNDSWSVVEIDAAGWRVIKDDPAVRFVRPRGLRPLPEPKASTDGISKLARGRGVTSSATDRDLEPVVTTDYTTKIGAERLAAGIRDYWSRHGHQVRVWVEPTRAAGWVLRSNLQRGLPRPPATG